MSDLLNEELRLCREVDVAVHELGEAEEGGASAEGLEWLRGRLRTALRRHDAIVSQQERQRPFSTLTSRPVRVSRVGSGEPSQTVPLALRGAVVVERIQ